MPTLSFTDGDDSYSVRDPGDYWLSFLAGHDILRVYGGTFIRAQMGEGADHVWLQSGDGEIHGDAGNDAFELTGSGYRVWGGADNDLFNFRGGSSLIVYGETGTDRFNFLADTANVYVNAGDGDDSFYGYSHAVQGTVFGAAGNDFFSGFIGTDAILSGGAGDDIYRLDAAATATVLEIAGRGTDLVQIAAGLSYTLTDNVENLRAYAFAGGSGAAATLTGNALSNDMRGFDNAETISGLDGNDALYGYGGSDALYGGAGNDLLYGGLGNDSMAGGQGQDLYYVDTLADAVTENADEGIDTVLSAVDNYVLGANVENGIVGSSAGLEMSGNGLANGLTGGDGNDVLWGFDGNDTLDGGAGYDIMIGGAGDDTYAITEGDVVAELPGGGVDTVLIGYDGYTLIANVEHHQLAGTLDLSLTGDANDNWLNGNAGNNVVSGGAGNDEIGGEGGNDILLGGDGNDRLVGGAGDDQLTGGAGADQFFTFLGQNSGVDTYIYLDVSDSAVGARDDIWFWDINDVLDLSAIDADTTVDGNQAFHLSANNDPYDGFRSGPDGQAGSLWYFNDGAEHVFIAGDVDGDSVADFQIHLDLGLHGDFIVSQVLF